ncbi:MAG: Arc family DNA-binding protein [Deltaproteobacteria bacterium]|nr:Arc family DNA-binding protein [Deltaproteobacteria bacterium]
MPQFIVRNVEPDVKARLQRRAARHGRSMEEELRDILRNALRDENRPPAALGSRLARRFAGLGLDRQIPELHAGEARPAAFDK